MPTKQNAARVAIYAWAGPGTIRLLETKYHAPNIDRDSFLHLYEHSTLKRAQDLLGVTDAFVTYSWGFSDEREQEDYAFLRQKLPNFQRHGIRTHAYVQGTNLVTADFADQDLWCRDHRGNHLAYSKGRSFTCPNNPNAVAVIANRVTQACREHVDGIFVDNILFGLPPMTVRKDFVPFFGCSCQHCQDAFATEFGYGLPPAEKRGQQITDVLAFRARTIERLIAQLAALAHRHNKSFGINLYDPTLRNDVLYYGYNLPRILPHLEYLLIENHSLPSIKVNNSHLVPLIQTTTKPVFVVSYRRGIGMERRYTQSDFDHIYTESKMLGYAPCYKATEFTTNGIWHALDLSRLTKPKEITLPTARIDIRPRHPRRTLPWSRARLKLLQRHYAQLSRATQERRMIASLLQHSRLYERTIKKPRLWQL